MQPRYQPANYERRFITESAELQRAAERFAGCDAIGVDLEMAQRVERRPGGVQEWIHVLALIQIASDDYSVAIDPVRCSDLSALRKLLAGPVRKVFLGGGQDVALLERTGLPTETIVDVGEVALALYGRREDGMAALARRFFDLSLDKTVRRADWLIRPLNPALLAYAYQDAELTLLIYRWFQQLEPVVLAAHERRQLDPKIPSTSPGWLQEATAKSQLDTLGIVMSHGLDPKTEQARLTEDVRLALRTASAPRQFNRLFRIAAELQLKDLLPDILPYADAASSLVRASAARAIAQLGDREDVEPVLLRLKQDAIEDVKKAAEAGLHDLRAVKNVHNKEEEVSEANTLGDRAMAALHVLRKQLEDADTPKE